MEVQEGFRDKDELSFNFHFFFFSLSPKEKDEHRGIRKNRDHLIRRI